MAVKALVVLGCNVRIIVMKKLLEKVVDNIEVMTMESGGEVVEKYNEGPQNYDVVFISSVLEDNISGIEVVKKIKEKEATTKIVGMSCQSKLEQAFLEAGANVFVDTAFNSESLGKVLSMIGII